MQHGRLQLNLSIVEGVCNKTCVHCVVPYFKERIITPYESIERFVYMNDLSMFDFIFIPYGEPLVHPRFFDILKLLHDNHANLVFLATNLYGELTDKEFEMLSWFELIDVDFSEEGQDPSTLGMTKKNYLGLVEYLKKSNLPCHVTPKRIWNPNLLTPLVPMDPVDTRPYMSYDSSQIFRKLNPTASEDEVADMRRRYVARLGFNASHASSTIKMVYDESQAVHTAPCYPNHLTITARGDITACFAMLIDDNSNLGNAFEESILDIMAKESTFQKIERQVGRCLMPDCCEHCLIPTHEVPHITPLDGFPEPAKALFKRK